MMARRPISLMPMPCGPRAPVAATGKALKMELREQYKDYTPAKG